MSLIINNDTVQGGKGTSTAYVHLSKHRKIERFSTFNFSLTLIIASFARRNSESQQVSQVAARDHFHDSFFFLRSSPLSFSLSFFFPSFPPFLSPSPRSTLEIMRLWSRSQGDNTRIIHLFVRCTGWCNDYVSSLATYWHRPGRFYFRLLEQNATAGIKVEESAQTSSTFPIFTVLWDSWAHFPAATHFTVKQ